MQSTTSRGANRTVAVASDPGAIEPVAGDTSNGDGRVGRPSRTAASSHTVHSKGNVAAETFLTTTECVRAWNITVGLNAIAFVEHSYFASSATAKTRRAAVLAHSCSIKCVGSGIGRFTFRARNGASEDSAETRRVDASDASAFATPSPSPSPSSASPSSSSVASTSTTIRSSQSTGAISRVGGSGSSPSAGGAGGSKYPATGASASGISRGGVSSPLVGSSGEGPPCDVARRGANVTVTVFVAPACRCPTLGENANADAGSSESPASPSAAVSGHSNRQCFLLALVSANARVWTPPTGWSSKASVQKSDASPESPPWDWRVPSGRRPPSTGAKTTSASYPSPTNAIVCASNGFRRTASLAACWYALASVGANVTRTRRTRPARSSAVTPPPPSSNARPSSAAFEAAASGSFASAAAAGSAWSTRTCAGKTPSLRSTTSLVTLRPTIVRGNRIVGKPVRSSKPPGSSTRT